MLFETLQRVLEKEAEPDLVQFQSFVFVHRVLFRVDVQRFLDFVLFLPFDLIKAGSTQTETSLLKQYVAGERVDLLDDHYTDYQA